MGAGAGAFFIAVNTSAEGDGAVPVWARKSGIDGDFLNPVPEDAAQIGVKIIVSLSHFSLGLNRDCFCRINDYIYLFIYTFSHKNCKIISQWLFTGKSMILLS
jgi:hypothetical protein